MIFQLQASAFYILWESLDHGELFRQLIAQLWALRRCLHLIWPCSLGCCHRLWGRDEQPGNIEFDWIWFYGYLHYMQRWYNKLKEKVLLHLAWRVGRIISYPLPPQAICKEASIAGFPTIQYFPPNITRFVMQIFFKYSNILPNITRFVTQIFFKYSNTFPNNPVLSSKYHKVCDANIL